MPDEKGPTSEGKQQYFTFYIHGLCNSMKVSRNAVLTEISGHSEMDQSPEKHPFEWRVRE